MRFQLNIRQPLLILSIILIIGIAAVSIFTYSQSTEISILSEQKTNLESYRADLMSQVVELQADLAEISEKNQQLIQDISSREESIITLEAELAEAKTQISELSKQIDELLIQIENLATPIDQRHIDPLILATQNCAQCHTQVVEQALAGESNSYHNTHFNNNLLNFNCIDCHKSVDIQSESEGLSRVIDNATCKLCHTTFPDKLWMDDTDDAKSFALRFPNCVVCHENWERQMKDVTFVNLEVITNSDCRTCHVDNAFFVIEKNPITIACTKCHID